MRPDSGRRLDDEARPIHQPAGRVESDPGRLRRTPDLTGQARHLLEGPRRARWNGLDQPLAGDALAAEAGGRFVAVDPP